MRYTVSMPEAMFERLKRDLFQSELEQAAFLYAEHRQDDDRVHLAALEYYLVPPEGWEIQHEFHLELTDEERARILKRARDGGFALIDCHSHPPAVHDVEFSPSDVWGITEFAQYVRWKLDGRPYAALVWGQASVDAVGWHSDFKTPSHVSQILVEGTEEHVLVPHYSFLRPRAKFSSRNTDYEQ
jgi:hypothetical protein